MPTFVTTIKFTEQGIKSIKDTTKRAAAFRAAAKKAGIKVVDMLWCLGPFDGVLTYQAPDAQTATAAMLSLASKGNVQTQTAQAFTAAEMDKVLAAM